MNDEQTRALLHGVRPTVDVDAGWARLRDELNATAVADEVVVVDTGRGAVAWSSPPRRRYRVVAVAGLVAAVVAATVLVWRALPGDGPVSLGTDAPAPSARPSHLVTSWAPEGLVLSRVDDPTVPRMPSPPRSAEDTRVRSQLFRPAGSTTGGILIEFESGSIVESPWPAVTVRGITGYRSPMGAPGADFDFSWNEPFHGTDRSANASVRGVSEADALAMLDSLELPAGDVDPGFQLPASSTWRLDGSVRGSVALGTGTSLVYDHAVPAGGGALHVGTVRGQDPARLLAARFAGTPRADGGFEVFETTRQTFRVNWPDGDEITLTGPPALSLDDDHRVVDSRRLVQGDGIVALVQQASAALVALPLIASLPIGAPVTGTSTATRAVGRIDIRGQGSSVVACTVFGAEPVVCSQNDPTSSPVAGGIAIGSTWYVFAVAKDDRQLLWRSGAVSTPQSALPAAHVARTGWYGEIAPVPDGVDDVTVTDGVPGAGGGAAMALGRPGTV